MSIGSILLGLACLILAGVIVARPVFERQRGPAPKRIRLAAAYQAALLSLRDLTLDHELGIIAAADYERQRSQLLARASQAMPKRGLPPGELDQAIEAAIHARRAAASASRHCARCEADLPATARFCSHCGTPAAAACRHCGQSLADADAFCSHCGTAVAPQPVSAPAGAEAHHSVSATL